METLFGALKASVEIRGDIVGPTGEGWIAMDKRWHPRSARALAFLAWFSVLGHR